MGRTLVVVAVVITAVACVMPGNAATPVTRSAAARAVGQPWPRTFSGSGSRVLRPLLGRKAPLVVRATHDGSANFVIKVVGNGANELLVNEIGRYSGQTVWADAHSGRYRIAVEADG